MIPSILAKQLEKGISDYIRTSFPMTNEPFKGSIDRLLDEKDSLYHEPYVSVKLPFRVADGMPTCFEAVEPEFIPFVHQSKAFERLTGAAGKSTLVATGTGSGKTECFLYPILDYCYKHRGEKGVKALIIYPMNALATDQAKRIAKLINANDKLRGNVTAGMYVGGFDKSGKTKMGSDHVITDHETMLNQAPDILLTNYKMLDYMLVRPKDANLWNDNNPETLKYIAVDELHTFDGAQGTDLACLIRRLKARLMIQAGYLCCIGTSATMGTKDSAVDIKNYASEVFGEWFEDDSVITEDRLSASEFFANSDITEFAIPGKGQIASLKLFVEEDNQDEYISNAIKYWFPDSEIDAFADSGREQLGILIMHHSFAQAVITAMGGRYYQANEIAYELKTNFPEIAESGDEEALMDSLFALISHARTIVEGKPRPFLFVQVQLWMRELRRLMAEVTDHDIHYSTAHDLNDNQISKYLPIVNCRDCGATGWATVLSPNQDAVMKSLENFYTLFFEGNTDKITMMFPGVDNPRAKNVKAVIDPESLHLTINDGGEMPAGVDVVIPNIQKIGRDRNPQYVCPFCGSKRGLAIMGQRGATEISVSLSQMFASKFNDDKKTLAFSDNVQDAAHRAGFFNAKTWRFGIRSAIQRYCEDGGTGKNLKDFQEGFIEYWQNKMTDEEFVSFFIAPNMTWKKAYEDMLENRVLGEDRLSKDLVEEIKKRLAYEIMLEYGVLSRMGRTLEVSGSSKLIFRREDIVTLADSLKERTVNELGVLKDLGDTVFQMMVVGYLDALRAGGAFADNVFNEFVEKDGDAYFLSNRRKSWLPGSMPGRNMPRFIADGKLGAKAKYRFDYLDSDKFSGWTHDCAQEMWLDSSYFDEISKILIEETVNAGLVINISQNDSVKVYALNKEKIFVTTDVVQIKCYECGSLKTVANENADIWKGAPCFRRSCSGTFDESDEDSSNYYGKLYSQGDLERINAVEHTGLLERNTREELEVGFKRSEDRQLWDPNVMSCTPTLEMGIDIGDLSTVVLCSMPPAQAQFMQRAGRAGRTDGNSLTLAIANSRPHDLYFYSDPLDMIQGEVAPPKVFLEASAVLERQFRAYCMDSWVKHGVEERDIPQKVGTVLSKFDNRSKEDFPYNFLEYVENTLSMLFNSFIRLFEWKPNDPVPEELRDIAFGDGTKKSSMHLKVLDAFERLKKEREGLKDTRKQLQNMIDEIRKKPSDPSYDEEIKNLEKEQKILGSIIAKMNDENVFNFLTDEGLIPNYAFPESGITLRAVLYRKKEDETAGNKKYDNKVYEYSRSASSAIREFAPNNSFYVEGRKLKVDQVDVATKEIEQWRLCPVCSHMELETAGSAKAYCPNCGSPAWADKGQVRSLLQIKTVYSNMDYSEAMIDDASDDRANVFYCSQLLVDVDEEHDISCAYQMKNDEFPFGYEFVRKATLRDINFGEQAPDNQGEMLTVAGQQNVRKGFQICKYCGKIQPEKGAAKHSLACKVKKNPSAYPNPFEKCLFLYRQFDTEILRILIPATTMDTSSVRTESFTAAFMLGMKQYFGNVDHLKATISEVPVDGSDYRKQYLVIYDSVPGGTGYLKQLMNNKESLVIIFEKALEVLENCSCKDSPEKDGCYHCLYAYRQSNNIGSVSRKTAIEMIKAILSGKDNLEEIDKLGNVDTNSLFDSELERKFIEVISRIGNAKGTVSIENALVREKKGYLLKAGKSVWEIEPQVNLGPSENVCVYSKPDFVIWPITKDDRKPVAIFTDGYRYHKDICADDTLKREAIRRSGDFRVWSLSYNDVENVITPQGDFASSVFEHSAMPSGKKFYNQFVKDFGAERITPASTGQIDLLIEYLSDENAEQVFIGQARAYASSILDPIATKDRGEFDNWNAEVDFVMNQTNVVMEHHSFSETLFGKWQPQPQNPFLTLYASIQAADARKDLHSPATVYAVLDDLDTEKVKYKEDWNGFWHFFNVMQFAPKFMATSLSGLNSGTYMSLVTTYGTPVTATVVTDTGGWDSVIACLFDDEAKDMAKKLSDLGIAEPDGIGFEVEDSNGAVIAEIEMAWTETKVAYMTEEQLDDKDEVESHGWTVITSSSVIEESIWR